MARNDQGTSQIVGFRIPTTLAQELKAEAKARGIRLNKLLAEMWELYKGRAREKPGAR
jgi:hypothetical protein